MIVARGGETHLTRNTPNGGQKLLGGCLCSRGRAHLITEQTIKPIISLGEHLKHDVHFVVVVGAIGLSDGGGEQIFKPVTITCKSAGKLVFVPRKLVAAGSTNAIEPLDILRFFNLQKRLRRGHIGMSLQILNSNPALSVAETHVCRLLEDAQRVFKELAFNVGRNDAVEQAAKLVEQVIVHGCEQVRHVVSV